MAFLRQAISSLSIIRIREGAESDIAGYVGSKSKCLGIQIKCATMHRIPKQNGAETLTFLFRHLTGYNNMLILLFGLNNGAIERLWYKWSYEITTPG
eukprot:890291_1